MPTIHSSIAALTLLIAAAGSVSAQTVDPVWEPPQQLSTMDGTVLDRATVIDRRGWTHYLWIEERLFEEKFHLKYSRFDGKSWSNPVVIEDYDQAAAGGMTRLAVKIDASDTLQMVLGANWAPAVHRRVKATEAINPKAWSGFLDIPISTHETELLVDVRGAMLLFYCPVPVPESEEPFGIFVMRSTDNGDTWTEPLQIDPGIPEGWFVNDLDAEWDGSGRVHVTWNYIRPGYYQVYEVKYANSLDGGKTWSEPIVLEGLNGADPSFNLDYIRLAIPNIAVQGSTVHVIYAGGGELGIGRRHLISTDGGANWSPPKAIWTELEGRAGSDVLYFDSHGRLHMMAQVRFPAGVYHAVYDNGVWSKPQLLYQIQKDHTDPVGKRIHAHNLDAVVTRDDNVVLTFINCGSGCPADVEWPDNPITFAMHTIVPPFELPKFTSVSSATYNGAAPVAPASIAAGFGVSLAPGVKSATAIPLPTQIDGLTIEVIDSAGTSRQAGLLFVSPQQVNYVIPSDTALGLALLRIRRNGALTSVGTMQVAKVSPAIYTVNGQGTGVASATWLFVAKNGPRTSGFIFNPTTGKPEPLPFDPSKGDLYLTFYGTGIRGYRNGVSAKIGDYNTPVLSVGPQGQFDGLDQINLGPLPAFLGAGGEWDVSITVDGVEANRTIFVTKDRQ